MKDLLTRIAQALVDKPEKVQVDEVNIINYAVKIHAFNQYINIDVDLLWNLL